MSACTHTRTEFLYRRDGIDYVRCLGCNTVFDSEDLESTPVYDDEDEGVAAGSGQAPGRKR